MIYFLIGIAALAGLYFAARAFAEAEPQKAVGWGRMILGGSMLSAAGVLALVRRWPLALPLFVLAVPILRRAIIDLRSVEEAGDRRSRVRSALFEMELDHGSGRMTGSVLAGKFEGRMLDDLGPAELNGLWLECGGDGESRALLEAYLDRRFTGWREDFDGHDAAGAHGTADAGLMSEQEAYEVLGLAAGAGEAEIRAAHHRLMKRLHPDQGGSTYLAAKINQAKERLLGGH